MTADSKGRDLFIVDNSVSGWTGLRYLEEWCSIAKAFDIATGCFEIGSLLALDGKWQPLDKIRILMGGGDDTQDAQSAPRRLMKEIDEVSFISASLRPMSRSASQRAPIVSRSNAIAKWSP